VERATWSLPACPQSGRPPVPRAVQVGPGLVPASPSSTSMRLGSTPSCSSPSRCAGSGPVFGGYPGVADRQSGHRALLKLAELTADRVSLGSGEARYEFCSTILRWRCRPQRCGRASTQRTPARHHPRTRRRSGRRRPCPLPTARSQPGGEPARTRRAGPSARTRRNPRHGDAGQVSATATRREMR